MERSEQLAAILGATLGLIAFSLIGWRTLVFPHDSPFWPLLIPLGLLILLASITPITRVTPTRFWKTMQAVAFWGSLATGLAVAVVIARSFLISLRGPVEEPGWLLIMFTVAFVPACAYLFCVVSIDRATLRKPGRIARWVIVTMGLLPVLVLGSCMLLELVV